MCQIIIIICSPVNFFFSTPTKKKEKKSEKTAAAFLIFLVENFHHLAMKKWVSKEGLEGLDLENFDQSRHISR
jgi:hypothetical protein